ncbi:MAG: zinc ribbon domain-containing protein [Leptospirales bacterium]
MIRSKSVPLADTDTPDRTYRCPCCGMEKDRDQNASLNILRLGLESRG